MNSSTISDINKRIAKELKEFSVFFKGSLTSNVALVDLIAKYILKQKGKKIRPLLVILSAKACGGSTERTYRGSVLVELLHTATLVHDDVVDASDKRRGFPSINAVWKNKAAVLMGDYLLSRGLMVAVSSKDYDFLEIITDSVRRMAEGELLQIQKTRKLDIDEATYFKIIAEKTGSLIETCCGIGAKSATEDPAYFKALSTYGANLGLAFQIIDDILDYEGSTKLFGKPIGGDIKEKKITLPLIYAMNNSDSGTVTKIKKLIKNNSKDSDSVKEVIRFVIERGGIQAARQTAIRIGEKAKESLGVLPESQSKDDLIALVDYVLQRKS
ncbi:octaprenyl-diphosphate synthase [uncultured bacterium]|nr:octaprenyl-diphosphate synthase [uncultured bacterium]